MFSPPFDPFSERKFSLTFLIVGNLFGTKIFGSFFRRLFPIHFSWEMDGNGSRYYWKLFVVSVCHPRKVSPKASPKNSPESDNELDKLPMAPVDPKGWPRKIDS